MTTLAPCLVYNKVSLLILGWSAVDGRLSHADNMGNKESLGRGAVQYLSAGTGITHSEMNDHAERCRFLQVCVACNPLVNLSHAQRIRCLPFAAEDVERKACCKNHRLLLTTWVPNAAEWPLNHSCQVSEL